jgi:hypothetical protein
MRIETFAICYNEEALLPYYLRHYSAFCDQITIYDNHSTDRSQEICNRNPIVRVIPYDSGNQIRDDIYLQIKNNCWKGSKADWVIIGDIDELTYHLYMRDILSQSEATVIRPALFNMYSEKFPTTPGQIWEEVKLGIPGGPKANIFRPDEVKEINYDPGCHMAHPEGNIILDEQSGIKTLHMRFLSKEYIIKRTELSRQRLSELNKKLGWGIHYHTPAEELGRQFDEEIKRATPII